MIIGEMTNQRCYYHCIGCGNIYADKEKTRPLVNVGKTLPGILRSFNISSGLCKKCEEENNVKRDHRRHTCNY